LSGDWLDSLLIIANARMPRENSLGVAPAQAVHLEEWQLLAAFRSTEPE
jgi:hypothetical protein